MTDPLVHRAQRGDEDAFRALYRAVQPGLVRYLRGLVGDADADDVTSETWLQLVRDLTSFRGDDRAFHAWAATVGRNRAMDHLRRLGRRPVAGRGVESLDNVPGGDDTAGQALAAVSTDAALTLIASLPTDQAEAVLLRVVMGLDARAAAQVLGKRPGAVRTAAHRGLRRLAGMLDAAAERSAGGSGGGVTDTTAAALREMR